MHPNPLRRFSCSFGYALGLKLSLFNAVPSVDSMHADFTTVLQQAFRRLRHVGHVVPGCAAPCPRTGHPITRVTLDGNEKVSAWQALFNIEIPLKGLPKIPKQPHVNQGKKCNRGPVTQELSYCEPLFQKSAY